MELPARHGPARHQPACHNPARPIADIFVPTGDIGGRGRGKGRAGRGNQPQGTKGGREDKCQRMREERGRSRVAMRIGRDRWEDDGREEEDNGGEVARKTGT